MKKENKESILIKKTPPKNMKEMKMIIKTLIIYEARLFIDWYEREIYLRECKPSLSEIMDKLTDFPHLETQLYNRGHESDTERDIIHFIEDVARCSLRFLD